MGKFTAVYGGSFDPVHIGHVMVVSHLLLNDPDVERIIIVPCFQQTGKDLKPFDRRLTMCKYAFNWLPKVEISTVEQTLGGESITLRTMKALKESKPNEELRFIIGSDLLASCKTWEGWDELEKIAPPLPIGRAGISPVREGDPTPISPMVSSSIVRQGLAKGDYEAVRRYLPNAVWKYCVDLNLYLEENPSTPT